MFGKYQIGFILCFSSSCSSFLAPVHNAVVRQRMCALSKGLQQVCRLKVYTAAVQMRYALYLGARSHSMMVIKLIQATFALAVESLPPFPAPPHLFCLLPFPVFLFLR